MPLHESKATRRMKSENKSTTSMEGDCPWRFVENFGLGEFSWIIAYIWWVTVDTNAAGVHNFWLQADKCSPTKKQYVDRLHTYQKWRTSADGLWETCSFKVESIQESQVLAANWVIQTQHLKNCKWTEANLPSSSVEKSIHVYAKQTAHTAT